MGMTLSTPSDWQKAAHELLRQATRRVRLREGTLTSQNWNDNSLAPALRAFLLGGPQRRAEILLADDRHLYAYCPALLEILTHFGHLLEIRLQQQDPGPECYFLADADCVLVRPAADNWNARYAIRDRHAAAPWHLQFEDAWERAGGGIPARPLGL